MSLKLLSKVRLSRLPYSNQSQLGWSQEESSPYPTSRKKLKLFESQLTNKDTFLDIKKENGNLNLVNELNELKKLHSEGIINDDEFKKAKQKILK